MMLHTEPNVGLAGLPRGALAGQVAIVTGAGGAVAREVARACAWLGAHVLAADLGAAGRETAEQILADGGAARFVPADIGDEGYVAHLIATASAAGPVGVLVNGAALGAPAPFTATTQALWDRTMALGLRGAFLCCRAVLPPMLARGSGVIVNLVAAEALEGPAADGAAAYGLIGLTRSLAAEVGAGGVRVVALAPALAAAPGRAELLPAGHAGAAAAHLIVREAEAFHGRLADGHELLRRAGLSPAGAALAVGEAAPAARPERRPPPPWRGAAPVPLARSESDALEQALGDLERALARAQEEAGELDAPAALHARWELLREALAGLLSYYARIPEEAARHGADPALIGQVAAAAGRRARLVADLLAALERT